MFEPISSVDWQAFHFLRPLWLWLLAPAFLALLLGFLGHRESIKWKRIIAPHLRAYMISKGNENWKTRMQVLLFLATTVGILGIAGPSWSKIEEPDQKLETPLVILLDLSQSMLCDDLQPTRLERAKFKINDLLEQNPRARTALIGFAGTAHTIIPLTDDYKIITGHLDGLSPSIMPFRGSNVEAALDLADSMISISPAPGTVLLFTDDFSEGDFSLFQAFLDSSEHHLEILPMNTPMGANVPAYNGRGTLSENGEAVHSTLNVSSLKRIASLEKATVHALTLDNSDVELIAETIRANLMFDEKAEESEDREEWLDMGWIVIIPLMFFVLLWFRKGWVVYSICIMISLPSCNDISTFKDFWFSPEYQGQRLSDQGDYSAAAETYSNPMRQGVAYFQDGNYDAAIQAFNRDTTAWGAYNLGIAYARTGEFQAAEMAFQQALEMNPELSGAAANQDIMQQLLGEMNEADLGEAQEAPPEQTADNIENSGPEDLSGGGQEATEEDMEQERKEETTTTDIRKGKELDEVPDDLGDIQPTNNDKILMRKVDDDPSLFLKRKFAYQVKTKNIKPKPGGNNW